MKSQLVEVCVYLKDIRLIGVTLLITAQYDGIVAQAMLSFIVATMIIQAT